MLSEWRVGEKGFGMDVNRWLMVGFLYCCLNYCTCWRTGISEIEETRRGDP